MKTYFSRRIRELVPGHPYDTIGEHSLVLMECIGDGAGDGNLRGNGWGDGSGHGDGAGNGVGNPNCLTCFGVMTRDP